MELSIGFQNSELRTQNSELRTQNSELRTQNSELRTQNSELRTQNSELRTRSLPMTDIRRQTVDGLKAGDTFTLTRTFTEKDVEAFTDVTRDHNPIHSSQRFVALKGFDDRICHGLLVGAMITEMGGQMGWLASGMNFRFKQPVYIGDTITCRCTLVAVDRKNRAEADAVFINQHGETVLEASLFGVLPNVRERQVLFIRSLASSGRLGLVLVSLPLRP
jgi:3-hydroxybutyryl-CoA dehydratase